MKTINHFENDAACFRIAHDGERVISVTYSAGKTSTGYEILTGESWEEIQEQLSELEIAIDDELIPELEIELE